MSISVLCALGEALGCLGMSYFTYEAAMVAESTFWRRFWSVLVLVFSGVLAYVLWHAIGVFF